MVYGQYEAALLFSDRHKAGARKMENRWKFDSKADAENYAKEANEHTTANVRYYVKEKRTGARCCSERNISTGAGCTQP